ncbi:MAG: hypothetical protein M5U28_47200 [Sandaracinaceae bacterium]|nr:hypothetical protein [Sandaracinaceae bacterium]
MLNAIAFATAITAITAFRFQTWRRPALVAGYFVIVAAAEIAAEAFLIPEGAIPPVTALVLFGIAALFAIAILVVRRFERAAGERR